MTFHANIIGSDYGEKGFVRIIDMGRNFFLNFNTQSTACSANDLIVWQFIDIESKL